jgi:hypothetical protein
MHRDDDYANNNVGGLQFPRESIATAAVNRIGAHDFAMELNSWPVVMGLQANERRHPVNSDE